MLNRILARSLRPTTMPFAPASSSVDLATRRFIYDMPPTRNTKNKAKAKERRRITRQKKSDAAKTPTERGEEVPPYFIPQRVKVLFKFYETHRNSTRLHRKPIPAELKADFAEKARAYAQYTQARHILMEREKLKLFKCQE